MSDPTHSDVPSPEAPVAPAPVSGAQPTSPAPVKSQSEWGDIPEEALNEWRWIMKGREEGTFDEYPGKHVAVYQQKVWGSSYDPDLLREYLALKHQIDPEKFVIVYIDRW